jgi:hypothetical protein
MRSAQAFDALVEALVDLDLAEHAARRAQFGESD